MVIAAVPAVGCWKTNGVFQELLGVTPRNLALTTQRVSFNETVRRRPLATACQNLTTIFLVAYELEMTRTVALQYRRLKSTFLAISTLE